MASSSSSNSFDPSSSRRSSEPPQSTAHQQTDLSKEGQETSKSNLSFVHLDPIPEDHVVTRLALQHNHVTPPPGATDGELASVERCMEYSVPTGGAEPSESNTRVELQGIGSRFSADTSAAPTQNAARPSTIDDYCLRGFGAQFDYYAPESRKSNGKGQ